MRIREFAPGSAAVAGTEASRMKTQRLSRPSTIAMVLVAVMILGVFVFPLWVISLFAPQYPQGLGLLIHVDRIEGVTPYDLQNINGLNHYIGMHKIDPGVIQELRYMKYFALGLALAAGLVALIRRRAALLAWAILAVSLAGVGMYDFYKWEYHYGHELDPSAAIKVPGMSYQPPMFGTRQMLNFTATAWPGVGGWLAIIAVGLGVACVFYEYRLRRRTSSATPRRAAHPAATVTAAGILCIAISGAMLLNGCAKKPVAFAFGTDACEQCSMTISDQRHGAEFVSDKGRSYKFDSVECMIQSLVPGGKFSDVTVHSSYVMDYAHPGSVVDATRAVYLVSPSLPSPMGANVSSFNARAIADTVRKEKGGDMMDWEAIQKHLREWAQS
jgi:copper chaperone NosL